MYLSCSSPGVSPPAVSTHKLVWGAMTHVGCDDTMRSFMNQASQKDVMNFISIAWTAMRSLLAGTNRCGLMGRKAPIHRWGLSPSGISWNSICS